MCNVYLIFISKFYADRLLTPSALLMHVFRMHYLAKLRHFATPFREKRKKKPKLRKFHE